LANAQKRRFVSGSSRKCGRRRQPLPQKQMSVDCKQRRVVITGMGVISPSGRDLAGFWENVRGGVSAAAPIVRFDASKLPVKIAAEVKGFDVGQFLKDKKLSRFTLTVQFGVVAATLAVKDSGVDLASLDPDRVGWWRERRSAARRA